MTDTTSHPLKLGDDRVVRKGEQVNIHTNVDMPDWMVRSYRRPAIFFEGKKYFLGRKDTSTYRRIRYQLDLK